MKQETKLNGICIDGKFYEAIPRGSKHCSDCDLFGKCDALLTGVCNTFSENMVAKIFRYSPELTDKINKE